MIRHGHALKFFGGRRAGEGGATEDADAHTGTRDTLYFLLQFDLTFYCANS